ncbi:MAG: KTSC domain-containing protein [Deltaproteobacteria bacterium]|jgi:hypothetical protein|nr:KTSC domain-containing protein [Deltaproteobacteria bacterium]
MSIEICDSIESRLILSLKYDYEKQLLTINFHKSKTLTYCNVPSEIWVDFLEATNPDEFYEGYVQDDFDTLED